MIYGYERTSQHGSNVQRLYAVPTQTFGCDTLPCRVLLHTGTTVLTDMRLSNLGGIAFKIPRLQKCNDKLQCCHYRVRNVVGLKYMYAVA